MQPTGGAPLASGKHLQLQLLQLLQITMYLRWDR